MSARLKIRFTEKAVEGEEAVAGFDIEPKHPSSLGSIKTWIEQVPALAIIRHGWTFIGSAACSKKMFSVMSKFTADC